VPVPMVAIGGEAPSDWQCYTPWRQRQSRSLPGSGLTDRHAERGLECVRELKMSL
jgi:hypothetical protein